MEHGNAWLLKGSSSPGDQQHPETRRFLSKRTQGCKEVGKNVYPLKLSYPRPGKATPLAVTRPLGDRLLLLL